MKMHRSVAPTQAFRALSSVVSLLLTITNAKMELPRRFSCKAAIKLPGLRGRLPPSGMENSQHVNTRVVVGCRSANRLRQRVDSKRSETSQNYKANAKLEQVFVGDHSRFRRKRSIERRPVTCTFADKRYQNRDTRKCRSLMFFIQFNSFGLSSGVLYIF